MSSPLVVWMRMKGTRTLDPSISGCAPVKMIHLTGPDLGFVWNAGVSANSPNPAAGQLFVNWLLSGQGQLLFNGPGNNSVLPKVAIQGSAPLSAKFITLQTNVGDAKKSQILSMLGLS